MSKLSIVFLGLSITSSWGNGHATTYRGLVRELVRRGHQVSFLEREKPWYAENRDLPNPPYGRTEIYHSFIELKQKFGSLIRTADLVVVGSYVPEGVRVGRWVLETATGLTAFYDIDTPVTLAKLDRGQEEYLSAELIPHYDFYLSFTGGPTLERLEREYRSPRALPLYCSVDPQIYRPQSLRSSWCLGYLGTYSPDRQLGLEQYLLQPAAHFPSERFIVAGPQFPQTESWPLNVEYVPHLPPEEHCRFYNAQRFTLNLTRADMVQAGWSPSVRLFEAASCGVPIISDWWPGLDAFFTPGREILIARSQQDVLQFVSELGEEQRSVIGARARERVMLEHTAAHRAEQLEGYVMSVFKEKSAQVACN